MHLVLFLKVMADHSVATFCFLTVGNIKRRADITNLKILYCQTVHLKCWQQLHQLTVELPNLNTCTEFWCIAGCATVVCD